MTISTALSQQSYSQQAYLKASNVGVNGTSGDNFGHSVAIHGDTAVVGAPFESGSATGVNGNQAASSTPGAGAVYVFVRSGTTWSQQAYLKASNTEAVDEFGWSVAISGDTLVVGADGEDSGAAGVDGNQSDNSAQRAGAAYVFVRSGTTWSQQAYLKASNPDPFDYFGWSVAISGETVVVGARWEESAATGINAGGQADNSLTDAGAAYVFVRSGTTWSQQAYLKASNTGANDHFGSAVAISGDTVVIGAPGEAANTTGVNGNQSDDSALDAGAAYVFTRSGQTWTQQAYLKAGNTGESDGFGGAVAISGETVVIGADGESSNATGIDGNGSNNVAPFAGAAYVFTRSGAAWAQQAFLKPSNTEAFDGFGWSVAISGNLVIVGAPGEDSGATGIGGDQSDSSADSAGAAYLFARSGTTWTQQLYLKASNTGVFDAFGSSVSLFGNAMVLGALEEDSNATGVNGNQLDNSVTEAGAAYLFGTPNTPPVITTVSGLSRSGGVTTPGSTIAVVSDAETATGSLTVTLASPSQSGGVTISNIANSSGTITADLTVDCTATAGTAAFTLQVSDGLATATATLSVTVNANTAPTLGYSAASVSLGGSLMINPATGPGDNGTINSITIQDKGTFTGTVSVATSGVVSISGSAPLGVHSITIRATDNCGTSTDTTISLTVACPTLTISPPLLSAGTTLSDYTVAFTQTGSATSITWSQTGTLPAGLSFSNATARLSGTPTATGTYGFTIRATDASGCFAEKSYTVVIGSQSLYEGDVAPRPGGEGGNTVSDWVQTGRFIVGLDTPQPGSEFQRADSAPRNSLGNGKLEVSDWVQAGRYAVALDPKTEAGGPLALTATVSAPVTDQSATLRVAEGRLVEGEAGAIDLELETSGEVNAVGLTLCFDSRQVTFINATAPSGWLLINRQHEAQGRLAIALALPPGEHFPLGTTSLIQLRLLPVVGLSPSVTSISIDSSLLGLQIVSPQAWPLARAQAHAGHLFINRKAGSRPD